MKSRIKTNKKIVSYLSYAFLIVGALIGFYVLIEIYVLKKNLPSGVCPVIKNRPLLYTAIAFCCISFVLSFFESKEIKD